jgi:hypothetical protein
MRKAGCQEKGAAFAAGAGEDAGVQGRGGGVPVDGGRRDAVADAMLNEPAGEVPSARERPVGDEQADVGGVIRVYWARSR